MASESEDNDHVWQELLAIESKDDPIDPKDDPAWQEFLRKYAWKGLLAEAREQIGSLDRDAQAELRYELIDQHASIAMEGGCSRYEAEAQSRSSTDADTVHHDAGGRSQGRGLQGQRGRDQSTSQAKVLAL